jgi:glycine C-acetyltransferase
MIRLKRDHTDNGRLIFCEDAEPARGLASLTRRLMDDGVVQFYLGIRDQFPDAHLKDMAAQAMDNERPIRFGNRPLINFGSDSILGFDQDPSVQKAIAEGAKKWGTHNGSSRAFCSVQANVDAEARLARWLGVEDTLIFPSVTLGNVGLLPALAGAYDLLVVDRLAQNSIHEGAKFAKAERATLKMISPGSGEKLSAVLAKENPCGFRECPGWPSAGQRHFGFLVLQDCSISGVTQRSAPGRRRRALSSS